MRRAIAWTSLSFLATAALLASPGCGDSKKNVGSGGGAGENAGGMGAGLSDVYVPAESQLGAACQEDDQCGSGLGCLTADGTQLAGEGAPYGFCSTRCNGDDDCQSFGDAYCARFDSLGLTNYCVPGCTPGATSDSAPPKCGGRPGVACFPLDSDVPPLGLCYPLCQSHGQCGPDRFCNPETGLCTADEIEGLPTGSECNYNPATDLHQCAGLCLPLSDGSGGEIVTDVCTQYCAYGYGCGWDDQADPADGVCNPFTEDTDVYDVGWCLQLCDCTDDCRNPNMICAAMYPDNAQYFHRLGFCTLPDPEDTELVNCPGTGGGAGASGGGAGGNGPASSGAGGVAGSGTGGSAGGSAGASAGGGAGTANGGAGGGSAGGGGATTAGGAGGAAGGGGVSGVSGGGGAGG